MGAGWELLLKELYINMNMNMTVAIVLKSDKPSIIIIIIIIVLSVWLSDRLNRPRGETR